MESVNLHASFPAIELDIVWKMCESSAERSRNMASWAEKEPVDEKINEVSSDQTDKNDQSVGLLVHASKDGCDQFTPGRHFAEAAFLVDGRNDKPKLWGDECTSVTIRPQKLGL
jgi:hypothetical protein